MTLKVPWWWPFLVTLVTAVALIFVALRDAPGDRRWTAAGSVLEATGAVLLGVPLIKSKTRSKSLAASSGISWGDFVSTNNPELQTDMERASLMGSIGLATLIGGFALQFVAQLFLGAASH
ncbi:MAG: hypothetical protein EPO16_02275 [Dehalococcoidia bacterium]|nr:MAG: hypothetical protein EPO16_02275 [Dehalococcoidia bacterium]